MLVIEKVFLRCKTEVLLETIVKLSLQVEGHDSRWVYAFALRTKPHATLVTAGKLLTHHKTVKQNTCTVIICDALLSNAVMPLMVLYYDRQHDSMWNWGEGMFSPPKKFVRVKDEQMLVQVLNLLKNVFPRAQFTLSR